MLYVHDAHGFPAVIDNRDVAFQLRGFFDKNRCKMLDMGNGMSTRFVEPPTQSLSVGPSGVPNSTR